MKRLLVSDEYPHSHDLGAILEGARAEILKGSHRMTNDGNPDTHHLLGAVLDCNARVVEMLSQAGKVIEDMGLASARHMGATVVVSLRTAGPDRHRLPRR